MAEPNPLGDYSGVGAVVGSVPTQSLITLVQGVVPWLTIARSWMNIVHCPLSLASFFPFCCSLEVIGLPPLENRLRSNGVYEIRIWPARYVYTVTTEHK